MKGLLLSIYFMIGFTTGTLYSVAVESAYRKGASEMLIKLPVEALVHVEVNV